MLTKNDIKYKIRGLKVAFEDGVTKFVLEKTSLTIARYLTRQLKLKEDHGWADHEIRDFALELEVDMKPPEIKHCETPQDYVEMYRCGMSSCMRVGTYSHVKGNVSQDILTKLGLWPSIWYHYNPYCQGLYTVDIKGKPTSRTFILEKKAYSHFYSDNVAHSNHAEKVLRDKGFSYKTYGGISITEPFRVPGVELDGTFYGPIPHCDDFNKGFGMAFDTKTKEFVFGGDGLKINSTYSYPGWLEHTKVPAL